MMVIYWGNVFNFIVLLLVKIVLWLILMLGGIKGIEFGYNMIFFVLRMWVLLFLIIVIFWGLDILF